MFFVFNSFINYFFERFQLLDAEVLLLGKSGHQIEVRIVEIALHNTSKITLGLFVLAYQGAVAVGTAEGLVCYKTFVLQYFYYGKHSIVCGFWFGECR